MDGRLFCNFCCLIMSMVLDGSSLTRRTLYSGMPKVLLRWHRYRSPITHAFFLPVKFPCQLRSRVQRLFLPTMCWFFCRATASAPMVFWLFRHFRDFLSAGVRVATVHLCWMFVQKLEKRCTPCLLHPAPAAVREFLSGPSPHCVYLGEHGMESWI